VTNETKAERKVDPRPLAKRANEKEEKWRKVRGLTKEMNRWSNAKAMKRRRQASNPKEPKAAAKFRRYRDRKLGKMGAASKVRHIDPLTGEERN
jgi:hypothetical protein